MKIIITIDKEKFEGNQLLEKIIASMHEELLQQVDKNTGVQYKDDEEKKVKATYEDDLADDFIEDELNENSNASKLKVDCGIIKKIKRELETDAMGSSGRSHLSGAFAEVDSIVGIRYKDTDNKTHVIRIFAHITTGIADEHGRALEEWHTQSLWTDNGVFIKFDD